MVNQLVVKTPLGLHLQGQHKYFLEVNYSYTTINYRRQISRVGIHRTQIFSILVNSAGLKNSRHTWKLLCLNTLPQGK